jgi:hypothetical protein
MFHRERRRAIPHMRNDPNANFRYFTEIHAAAKWLWPAPVAALPFLLLLRTAGQCPTRAAKATRRFGERSVGCNDSWGVAFKLAVASVRSSPLSAMTRIAHHYEIRE